MGVFGNTFGDKQRGNFLGTSLASLKNQMAFWSDTFDFTTNQLLDKSGNNNHIALKGGYCVNFINNITITLYPAQTGATVTEVNKSAVTTGVTVSSGNIAIVPVSLPNPKIYQIKLSTGDEFFLTGGTNSYVFCNSTLYGKLGGTENTDWQWSTQNNYFGNLQYGFTKGGALFDIVNLPMNSASWTAAATFTKVDANTVLYTGGSAVANSTFYCTTTKIIGHSYEVKITIWDSTEDFSDNKIGFRYLTGTTGTNYLDDDGIQLYRNGEHYFTFIYLGPTNRVQVNILDTGLSWTGKSFKFKINYCKEKDPNILIPAYNGSLDRAGNTLTYPAITNTHNGCEVKLDFSSISGVTDANGDVLSLPSAYAFGTSLTNPQFKRLKYSSDLYPIETDYIVFNQYTSGDILSSVLRLTEEPNMLVKTNLNGSLIISKKWDTSYDVVFVFDKVGYNEVYQYTGSMLIANTASLPLEHESLEIGIINDFQDFIGPYSISGIAWAGGSHEAPSDEIVQATWTPITASDNTLDQITVTDVSTFPAPPSGKKRLVATKIWNGTEYPASERASYVPSGNILSLTSLRRAGTVDLSAIVVGGEHPSQAVYIFKTLEPGTPTITGSASNSWVASKEVIIEVINDILDYTQIDKDTLTGGKIIEEKVTYKINQKSSNVFVDYESEFIQSKTISTYYGLQYGSRALTGTSPKVYFAHGENTTMQDSSISLTSGARATYASEKYIMVSDSTNNSASNNIALFVDLDYGTPLSNEAVNSYWITPSKTYFNCIYLTTKNVGDTVKWRGGYNNFKNVSSTPYIIAYYQYENGSLYFIVDFTGSLTFAPSVIEVITIVAGRRCQLVSKDDSININGISGDSFTIPNTGLSLTATSAGNIKLMLF